MMKFVVIQGIYCTSHVSAFGAPVFAAYPSAFKIPYRGLRLFE